MLECIITYDCYAATSGIYSYLSGRLGRNLGRRKIPAGISFSPVRALLPHLEIMSFLCVTFTRNNRQSQLETIYNASLDKQQRLL